ncbi:hypothetical protein COLO4_21376 [Corchorus olitorius]|uniref:Calmodulin-binding domain-containing protein n=1 Tax=Corchorus olitorius TaxID=93759 RepID=A0A1R3ITJ5_9ROSI|nr:hypothetical protein COLO4_21376 [Corchorus olitorius]
MAEESISSSVSQDITKPAGGDSRRSSLAGDGSVNSGDKTLSRYLRASTGSCHDLCKYGKKHESEVKARRPFPRRIVKKACDEPNSFESLDLPRREKTSAVKSKSVPNSRTHTPDTSDVINLQVSTDTPDRKNSRRDEILSKKEKTSVAKLKPKHSPNSRSHSNDSSDVIKLQVPTDSPDSKTARKPAAISGGKRELMAKLRSSPNLKSRLSDAPKIMQQDGSLSSERVGVSSKEVSSKTREKSFSKRRAISLKLASQAEKSSSSVPSEGLSARRNSGISDMKFGKRSATAKVAAKKLVASPRPSIARATSLTTSKNRNLKAVPPQKSQNKVKKDETEQPLNEHNESNNDTLQEKTLYVIKMETENLVLESDKNENCAAELSSPNASSPKSPSQPISTSLSPHSERDQDESEYTVSEAEDDYDSEYDEDETVKMEETDILEGENGGRPRNAGMVISDDKDCQPVKLSFRRGKVVDIQSENNGPRRLKFRRGRVLGGNQTNKSEGRRTFRRGVDDETNDNKSAGEKVVLRHQDVQGKKDDKVLFNNVIEETASKLVETRKSKVKALVGAFETVISLQDTKPSANTVA